MYEHNASSEIPPAKLTISEGHSNQTNGTDNHAVHSYSKTDVAPVCIVYHVDNNHAKVQAE